MWSPEREDEHEGHLKPILFGLLTLWLLASMALPAIESMKDKAGSAITRTASAVPQASPGAKSSVRIIGQSQYFTTPGEHLFAVPAGITRLTVELWGASESETGLAGGYIKAQVTVEPGQTYAVKIEGMPGGVRQVNNAAIGPPTGRTTFWRASDGRDLLVAPGPHEDAYVAIVTGLQASRAWPGEPGYAPPRSPLKGQPGSTTGQAIIDWTKGR